MRRNDASALRGRPNAAAVDERVRAALRAIDDPIVLEASPLVRLDSVRSLAEGPLRGRTCAEGLALRFVLRKALADIANDLIGTPIGALSAALHDGRTQAEVAIDLGITQEHLSRRWKGPLVSLVRERIERPVSQQQRAA
ncbi:MAG: hypothetical protein R3C29_13180 [Dehalococcoidia bacterium]